MDYFVLDGHTYPDSDWYTHPENDNLKGYAADLASYLFNYWESYVILNLLLGWPLGMIDIGLIIVNYLGIFRIF